MWIYNYIELYRCFKSMCIYTYISIFQYTCSMLCNSACALHVYKSLSIYKLNAFDSAEASNKNSEEVHMVIPKTELSCAYAWEEGCLGLAKVYTWFRRKVPITRLLRGFFSWEAYMLVSTPWTYAKTSQRHPLQNLSKFGTSYRYPQQARTLCSTQCHYVFTSIFEMFVCK